MSGSETVRAAVIGGTGYGGAELIRLIMGHPRVSLARVSSIDFVGEPIEAVHLSLAGTGLVFEDLPPGEAGAGMDVVFLALPHKVSFNYAPELEGVAGKIIDLSGDFRLQDADAYEAFYGIVHPHPEALSEWVYGMPEINRDAICEATRVASPGCFATAIALGLLPAARAGLLSGAIQTVAMTGSSGSGAYAKPGTHHPLRVSNMKPYKVFSHQHCPEIEQTLRIAAGRGGYDQPFKLNFVPVSAPIPRGILATSFCTVPDDIDDAKVESIYRDFYADAKFVRVLGSEGRAAEVVAIKGSMWVDLSWKLSESFAGKRQLAVTTAADNLVKGGAGQAVQSMNLMLGLPEGEGIDAPALWP